MFNVPFCVFSKPEIISIGNTSLSLKQVKVPFNIIGKAHCNDSYEGFLKLFLNDKKDIIGAVAINNHASELLAPLTIIINKKLNCNEIKDMIFMHPTMGEIIKEAAIKAMRL